MKRNKKGISLAIVIVVVMALMIFSAMLFSAASHSLSMTGESTDGRQTYLTAKSAIEFSKTTAFDLAKAGSLKPFAVTIGADGSFAQDAGVSPDSVAGLNLDGTKDCAKCWNTGGNTWKMLANIKYKNSAKFRQLAYTFTLTPNASVNLPASDFLACGIGYGQQRCFNNSGWYPEMTSTTVSGYPLIESMPLAVSGNPTSVTAPEILMMGDSNLQPWGGSDSGHYSIVCVNSSRGAIHSDQICIGNDIYTPFTSDNNVVTSMAVVKLYPSTSGAVTGVIYFAGNNGGSCIVKRSGTDGPFKATVSIPNGYYSFEAGFDICSIVADPQSNTTFLDSYGGSGAKKMTKISSSPSIQSFMQNVNYANSLFTQNQDKIITGATWSIFKGANFESNGVFAGNSAAPSRHNGAHWNVFNSTGDYNLDENAVFTYVNSVGWPTSAMWPRYTNPYGNVINGDDWSGSYNIYCAKQFFLRFVSPSNNFVLPSSYNAVFHSDLVSLSMAVSDTNAGTNAAGRPKIIQATNAPTSQFLLTSLSTDASGNYKDITLAIQNDIEVHYYQKLSDNNYQPASYVIPSGVYSVQSGFNFFDSTIITKWSTWSSFWTNCRKGDYPVPGSGGSGGAGGFTITPGAYSGS